MTAAEAEARVAAIATMAKDMELLDNAAAHEEEDSLWHDVLVAIADGAPEAALLAAIALRTSDLKFQRWFS